ncbi:class I adenylate-forming enzyme family protein [uncultured Williamsia sp.]|uniref:class I adenylate-forming enzyme family protein n=1 Tax=uncultured Williamsia sp. TaxID=259311 RepID=UPI0026371AE5|nr:class I adenylate-forming enzyme family protein [uncultured Williamsia sp.]
MTLADLLDNGPTEPVHLVDRTVPRDELTALRDEIAVALTGLDMQSGHIAAVMLGNTSSTIATLFGVWSARGVYAPLNPRAADPEITSQLETLGPLVVITDAALAPRFDVHRAAGLHLVVVDGDTVTAHPSDAATPAPPRFDDDVALLQFTSGTTGRPKPVPLRHSTVLDLVDRLQARLRGRKSGEKSSAPSTPMPNLVPLSLSLWAGIYQVIFAFRAGAGVVLMDRFEPVEFATLVRRHGIRSTVLPPAALTMTVQSEEVTDLAPLRIVRSITAPLSPVVARRFYEKFGVMVLNSYGQTELGGEVVGWSAADSREFGADKIGSVGRPLPGIEVRIDEGEVVVRTPSTAAGRVDSSLLDRLAEGGWFHTGDLGWLDEDGFLWLDGRVSDMINRGGLKVFPGVVEDVLLACDGVADAAVVGVPDERVGELPWGFVVRSTADVDEAAVTQWCRDHLTPYRVPARLVFVDELPRNDVGKVLKRELSALAETMLA